MFALGILLHVAQTRDGNSVLLHTCRDPHNIIMRMLACASGMHYDWLSSGRLKGAQWNALLAQATQLSKAKLILGHCRDVNACVKELIDDSLIDTTRVESKSETA